MATATSGFLPTVKSRRDALNSALGLDSTVTLEIDGTRQRVRFCGAYNGLPPVLVVQAGPGFPLLNEVARFQRGLRLESEFSVAYWDQRGCGNAASEDARAVSLESQIDDACTVIRWLSEETRQPIVVLGISLGGAIALQAVAREAALIKALVTVSIDLDTAANDAAAHAFLLDASARGDKRVPARSLVKLGTPPYADTASFQLRARLMTDAGGIEQGRRFSEIARGLLFSLVRTYGIAGAFAALRNMNAIQRTMLPEIATLNLFAKWPRPSVPVHYIFGQGDPLMSRSAVQRLSAFLAAADSVVTLPGAGHMAHFDQPDAVRSAIVRAYSGRSIP